MNTQEKIILKMLAQKRTVSKLTAVHLNIGNLAEVIRRLRNRGWDILTVSDHDGSGRRFTRYEASNRAERVTMGYAVKFGLLNWSSAYDKESEYVDKRAA